MIDYDLFLADAYLYSVSPVQLSHDRIVMKDYLRKNGVRLIKPYNASYTPLEQIISEYTNIVQKKEPRAKIVNTAWELD